MRPTRTIYPVVLSVPPHAHALSGRPKVAFLSSHARKALARSARRGKLPLKSLEKDPNGSPLPSGGVFWSVTHKPLYVAGLAAISPIGIDLEPVRPRNTTGLFSKVASRREWDLIGGPDWPGFYRFWTAKEAVLKAAGVGLQGLSRCRIDQVVDTHHLTVDFAGRVWTVAHAFFDDHIASVVHQADTVEWTID